jgi:methionyl aminopeptidase
VIQRRTDRELDQLRRAGRVVAAVRRAVLAATAPGRTTRDLDAVAEQVIREHGATPAFKGYRGYPATICASVNEQVVHGIPDDIALAEGDVVSIDVGAQLGGYFGDAAFTVALGTVPTAARNLIEVTEECLRRAIALARPGNRLSDISHAVESCAVAGGLSVVRQFGGHGIGRSLHEEPHINNYGPPGKGPLLQPGFVLAIEPILCLGNPDLLIADDGWTASTADGSLAAHAEHTVAVTADGPLVLTADDAPVEGADR